MIPGEYGIQPGDIESNASRRTLALSVANIGGRPIQVGLYCHFFEVDDVLVSGRPVTCGICLNIVVGTAMRFELGQSREVELVRTGGGRRVYGFAGRVMGDPQGPFPTDQARGKTTDTDDHRRSVR